MILTDKEILNSMEKGLIKVEPFVFSCLGTNSYDVHLGKTLAVYTDHVLDAKKHNLIQSFEIKSDIINPLSSIISFSKSDVEKYHDKKFES